MTNAKDLSILGTILFSFLLISLLSAGPAPAESLTVTNGQVIVLPGGKHTYDTITIEPTGSLELTGETEILCSILDLSGKITFTGETRMVIGHDLVSPHLLDYSLRLGKNGSAHIYPKWEPQQLGDSGNDGSPLSIVIFGHVQIAGQGLISASGQDGKAGWEWTGEDTCPGGSDWHGIDGIPGGDGGRGGALTFICSGDIYHDPDPNNTSTKHLELWANGGAGGDGGHGCHGAADASFIGNGGDAAMGGVGGVGGFLHLSANRVKTASLTLNAFGGRGGNGGNGGNAGIQNYDVCAKICIDGGSAHGGEGAPGNRGGDGGRLEVLATCELEGAGDHWYTAFRGDASGGLGGNAGRSGSRALDPNGLDNQSGWGANGGEISVTTPAIAHAQFVAAGGAGGDGGMTSAQPCGVLMNNECIPSGSAQGGDAADGGGGGMVTVTADVVDLGSLTSDVTGGAGGEGGGVGTVDERTCYTMSEGNEGILGTAGSCAQASLGVNSEPDSVVVVLSANKSHVAPGDYLDYSLSVMPANPIHNVAISFTMPANTTKVETIPQVPLPFQVGEIQWNVSDLLPCEGQIFKVRIRISDTTQPGKINSRAKVVVNGVNTYYSSDVPITVENSRTPKISAIFILLLE